MAISAVFYQKNGYAFKPESISFGDGETLDVKINRNGTINTIPIIKRQVTLSLEGATNVTLSTFQNERDDNIAGLIAGSTTGEDMDIMGYLIEKAVLTKVTPSAPITVNGITVFDKIDLQYDSQVYS